MRIPVQKDAGVLRCAGEVSPGWESSDNHLVLTKLGQGHNNNGGIQRQAL